MNIPVTEKIHYFPLKPDYLLCRTPTWLRRTVRESVIYLKWFGWRDFCFSTLAYIRWRNRNTQFFPHAQCTFRSSSSPLTFLQLSLVLYANLSHWRCLCLVGQPSTSCYRYFVCLVFDSSGNWIQQMISLFTLFYAQQQEISLTRQVFCPHVCKFYRFNPLSWNDECDNKNELEKKLRGGSFLYYWLIKER
jgi:hypothetical protein